MDASRKWLESSSSLRHASNLYRYSQKHHQALFDKSVLSRFRAVPVAHRIMEALTNLSKFLGMYPEWKEMREKTGLVWRYSTNLDVIRRILHQDRDVHSLPEKILQSMGSLGRRFGLVYIFDLLTGLRDEEALDPINLVSNLGR